MRSAGPQAEQGLFCVWKTKRTYEFKGTAYPETSHRYPAELHRACPVDLPFAIIALAIKLDSKGSLFFRQERVGKDGRSFKVWKFRTMVEGAVGKGLGHNVAKDDSRITRIGSALRNWGLDEFP